MISCVDGRALILVIPSRAGTRDVTGIQRFFNLRSDEAAFGGQRQQPSLGGISPIAVVGLASRDDRFGAVCGRSAFGASSSDSGHLTVNVDVGP